MGNWGDEPRQVRGKQPGSRNKQFHHAGHITPQFAQEAARTVPRQAQFTA